MQEEIYRGWIYKITSTSGRIYIGQTTNVKERYNYYKYMKCKRQKLLYQSFVKYGFYNHSFEIIDKCQFCGMNNCLLDTLEIYWIKEYKSNKNRNRKENGMNLTDGGRGTSGFFGRECNEETRLKISKAQLGDKNHMFGKIPTNAVPINVYDHITGEFIGTYMSYKEAADFLNINKSHINQVVNGKRNSSYGFIFKRITDSSPLILKKDSKNK